MTDTLKATLAHWPELSQSVFVPHTEMEYRRLVALLGQLVDEVGNDESHPLASLTEVVGLLIEKYEDGPVPRVGRIKCGAGTTPESLASVIPRSTAQRRCVVYLGGPEPRGAQRLYAARAIVRRLSCSCWENNNAVQSLFYSG
jgi:HTH-type transcriptional regulator/antitoxin HigA